jgi:O-antigen ligase
MASSAHSLSRQSYWLMIAVVFSVLITVSGQTEYAKIGGDEVYDELTVGSTFTRQVAFLALAVSSILGMMFISPASGKRVYWPLLLPFLGLVALGIFSTVWSDLPSMTFKRAIVSSIIIFSGIIIGRIWDAKQFACALIVLSSSFLFISVLLEIYYRSFLFEEYRFSGIFHPSKQAFNCGLLAIASTAMYFESKRRGYIALAMLALAFVLLTKSRTGLGATCLALGTIGWAHFNWHQRFVSVVSILFMGVAILGALGAFLPTYEVEKVALLGRDEESADPRKLTGRLPIWSTALEEFSERPILGFGYGAFWSKKRLGKYERLNGWALTHSHSAYIEALVNVGAIGFAMGLGLAFFAYQRFWRLKRDRQHRLAGHLCFAILTLAFLAGITEIAFIGDGYEAWTLAGTLGFACFSGRAAEGVAEVR